MATEAVWYSGAFGDSRLVKSFDLEEEFKKASYAKEDTWRFNKGAPLPKDEYPTEIYGGYVDLHYKRQPDLFTAGVGLIVSAATAEVLRGADMGRGALYPIKLFQQDRTTPVEGEYFSLNIGETKAALVPEQSEALDRNWPGHEVFSALEVDKNDQIAVRDVALAGADIWIDPAMSTGFFVSDRLATALKAAKVTRNFRLKRCRVLKDH